MYCVWLLRRAKTKWVPKMDNQKRDVESTANNESQRKDRKIDEAIAFFQSPDKEHTWADWLRILLEDLFVIDAPCIYPRKTLGGDLFALEVIDGATIKRVLDNTGRLPAPPDTAYQQILHGMAAVSQFQPTYSTLPAFFLTSSACI